MRHGTRASGSSRVSFQDPDTLREFVRSVREGIYITSVQGKILDANPAFLEIFGVASLEELQSYSVEELLVDPSRRSHELELLDRDGAIREFELQIRRVDGQLRTVLDTTYTCRDPESGETFFHGILVDITARKALEEQLRELSLRDPLTGCYNRRYLSSAEYEMLTRGVDSWGCIFLDIDHFKQFNDRHGHAAGDEALLKMSRFLTRQARAEEVVIRVGGDEFVILLAGANAEATEKAAQRLQVSALRTAPVAFSLGWAARECGESLEKTLGRADHGLLAVRVVERSSKPDRREVDLR